MYRRRSRASVPATVNHHSPSFHSKHKNCMFSNDQSLVATEKKVIFLLVPVHFEDPLACCFVGSLFLRMQASYVAETTPYLNVMCANCERGLLNPRNSIKLREHTGTCTGSRFADGRLCVYKTYCGHLHLVFSCFFFRCFHFI